MCAQTCQSPTSSLTIEEQLNWVKLSLVSKVGSKSFYQLLQAFDSPTQVFNASQNQLTSIVKADVAREIKATDPVEALEKTKSWLLASDNHLVTLADSHYPKSLLEISDPPPFLYAKGDLSQLSLPSLAMVGGRNATTQGERNAEAFAQTLSNDGFCIISGMAVGIDGAAHRGALAGSGNTIAVVGTGLDIVYPARHRDLAHQIVQNGLLLSEFPLGTPSIARNFPRRNRIISGLSLGCLVVEANTNSGSLITAKLAAEQGREVFAIPGSIHSPMAKGCHQLIKQGAKLVESTEDIVEELRFKLAVNEKEVVENEKYSSDTERVSDHPLLSFIGFEPTSLESIVQKSGLSTQTVSATLMELELEGKVANLPGEQYQQLK